MSDKQIIKEVEGDRVFLPGRELRELQLLKRAGIVYIIGICLMMISLGELGVPLKYVLPILLVASAVWVGSLIYLLRRRRRLVEVEARCDSVGSGCF